MATININGSPLEYIEKGSGIPVLFVHGGISDYRIWSSQMEPFSEKYRVIAYSRRYHYPNEWNGDGTDYSVGLHAQDLATFIRELDLEGVNVIGNSYGAYTALVTAMNNPGLIRTLVLNEPPVLPLLVTDPDNPLQLLSLFIRDLPTAISFMQFALKHMKPAMKAVKENQLEKAVRLFAGGVLGEGGFEKLPEEARATTMDNAAALKAEFSGPGFPAFPKTFAGQLHIPVLLIYGQKSPKFLHSISNLLLNILPDCEKIVIPGASHLTHGENPIDYNRNVLDFLSKHN